LEAGGFIAPEPSLGSARGLKIDLATFTHPRTRADIYHRHGWGCTADPQKAMTYLSAAAANAASIEDLALRAGSQKGGEAKGELVLAIFELANSFRHGWGIKKDPVAAKQVRDFLPLFISSRTLHVHKRQSYCW
jgi:hypothetical protein